MQIALLVIVFYILLSINFVLGIVFSIVF